MGEQDRRPIWFALVTSNDGSPRASMTTVVLSPLRKQGDVSKIPAAPTAVLLQGSDTSPTATLPRTQGSSTSPTATLACTQGSSTSLPDTLAHSYTPHCTPGPSPCIYKREVQGLHARGRGVTRENELTNRLTLSLANACNPYYEHTPLARGNTSHVFPLVFHLAPTHLGWDAQRQIYSSVQGPPGSKRRQSSLQFLILVRNALKILIELLLLNFE
jgi:hypothetical protein